jgi:hypothetical protein
MPKVKVRILTDGGFSDCKAAVGQVVEAYPYRGNAGVLGYDVPVTALTALGCTVAEYEADSQGNMYFSRHLGCDETPECMAVTDD